MTQELKVTLEKAVEAGLENGCRVNIGSVRRTNSTEKTAATILQEGSSVGRVVYIDDLLESGKLTVAEIANEIIKRYSSGVTISSGDISQINSSYILSNVTYRPASIEGGRTLPEGTLYKNVLDVIMLYSVPVKLSGVCGHFNVVDRMLTNYQISMDELDAAAQRNTQADGFVTKTMGEILAELVPGAPVSEDDFGMMYIVSNTKKMFGASVLLYAQYFDALAQKLGDLYILPSSVHEVIIVPKAAGGNVENLREMVMSVNETEVSEEEFLSNNVYIYNAKKHELKIA